MDLFLTFLLPEHAAEIGKFFEHFVLNNMKNLLRKLNLYFHKQPSYLKKVYACLNELSNEKDLTMDRLKERVLPLLKGNQLLIDWFLQLFEKPLEGVAAEFESVYIKKSLSDSESSFDNYEEIHSKDLVECDNVDELNACGVRYKNGKIMYHGTLLPAKISFLAHDAPSPSSFKDENPLCSHEIRKHVKFNDPKKADATSADEVKKKRRRYKLCDASTLHAHAVRLNSVHAQNGEKLSDLAHLLTPTNTSSANGDEKASPKKPKNPKKSPKKSLNKSPSSSSGNSVNISPPSNSPSKALQTAKKLRNLMDEDEPSKKKSKPADEPPKPIRIVTNVVSADRSSRRAQRDAADASSSSRRPESDAKSHGNGKNSTAEDGVQTGLWTRNEDRIILEEIKVGYPNKEDLLDMCLSKLERSREEISARYEFLYDIIVTMTETKD